MRAIELGADAIELDVHATADGKVVVHHDPVVNAPDLPVRRISEMGIAELSRFRLDQDIEIPTLEDVLRAINDRAFVYVEVKATSIEPLVVRAIRESSANCAVHSFDHRIVHNVKSIFPALRTGVLQVGRHVDPVAALKAAGAQDLWQEVPFIDEDLVARAHDVGARVIAWTADPEWWRPLREIGIDGICTDHIAELATFSW